MTLTRRSFAWLTALFALAPRAVALGRKPYGGVVRMKLPWPLDAMDPHAIGDVPGQLFGAAIADPLYAVDANGRPYPALAAGLPESVKGGFRITLRPNLLSALGKPMDARDVIWSLLRAEKSGAAGLLGPLGRPSPDPTEPLAVTYQVKDSVWLMGTLSSPLTAILPRSYSRLKPDGTGSFLAEVSRDALILKRNLNAARGAAFLDRIEIRTAPDLSDPLRAFEASETDVSWLGEFLHNPRSGAVKYDAGAFGWVVLMSGKDAGKWGAPGIAQSLLDALPQGRLTYLGLSNASGGRGGDSGWGGEAAEILVVENATHLEAIGKELAALFSRPGHELRVAVRPRREFEYRREQGRYSLLLDFARPVGLSAAAGSLGVLTLAGSSAARKPPSGLSTDPRDVARSLPLGVVGQLRASGAHVSTLHDVANWDLGAIWKK